jgi:hypothetical protein
MHARFILQLSNRKPLNELKLGYSGILVMESTGHLERKKVLTLARILNMEMYGRLPQKTNSVISLSST